jgi:hypothetical protein
MSDFKWTKKKSIAAEQLAQGYTTEEAAATAGVCARQVYRWKTDINFNVEVDRLSLMLDIAGRAYRLRLAMKRVRELEKNREKPESILDYLKYAQSETDGVKLDIAGLLAALSDNAAPVAGGGSARDHAPEDKEDS